MAGIIGGGASLSLPTLIQKIRVSADTADAEAKTQGALDRFGSKVTKTGAILTGALTLPIVGLAAASVSAASDMNESVSKVGVVFGDSAQKVLDWSETTATALGVGKQAALEAAGTFGNLFSALGIGAPVAADMSIKLVQLASDLASFNNADPSDVLLALQSGLVGEVEPLRKFGVSLSAARVEAEALSTGILKPFANFEKIEAAQQRLAAANENVARTMRENGKESIEFANAQKELADATDAFGKETKGNVPELDAAAKAQAAYQAIMKDTALAQGDFSRTSGGLANQQRIASAQFEDAKAKLGQGLLPVMVSLTGVVNSLLGAFLKLPPSGQKLILMGLGLLAALGPVLVVTGQLIKGFNTFGGAITKLPQTLAALRTAFTAVTSALTANPWILVAIAAVAAVILIIKNWDKIAAFFSKLWDGLKAGASAAWNAIVGFASAAWAKVTSGVSKIPEFLAGIWRSIQETASSIFSAIADFFDRYWKVVVLGIFTGGLSLIVFAIVTHWNTIRDTTVAIWNAILSFLGSLPGLVASIFSNLVSLVVGIIGSWLSFMAGVPGQIIGLLSSLATSLPGLIGGAFFAAVGAAQGAAGDLIGVAAGLPGEILGALGDLGSLLFDAGADIIRGLINGITSILPSLWDKISGIPGGIVDVVKGGLGIDSPSRVMADQIGRWIPLGIVSGIDATQSSLDRRMSNLVDLSATVALPVTTNEALIRSRAGGSSRPVESLASTGAVESPVFVTIEQMVIRDDSDIEKFSRSLAARIDDKRRARGLATFTTRPI